MRVLHCPSTVGGNPQGLSRAERGQGCDSVSWTLTQNHYLYPADRVICPTGGRPLRALLRWWAIGRMVGKFDVVHFNFGSSFAPLRIATAHRGAAARLYNRWWSGRWELADVAWAKRRGAVIAVTYQGDDARQGDFCRARYPVHFSHHVPPGYYTPETDEHKRERIRFFDRHADLIYALNPDLLHVLPERAQFLGYASVDPREWTPVYLPEMPAEPLVVHAPSNRAVKGTAFLLEAVERLKAEGVAFRFQLVEGLAHAEARRLYASADLAVDQLLAGFYGAFAVELMALGKPVICQLNPLDLRRLPEAMRRELPILHADPGSIYGTLREWLTARKGELRTLGERSRAYVECWHDPVRIAERVVADYRRKIEERRQAKP